MGHSSKKIAPKYSWVELPVYMGVVRKVSVGRKELTSGVTELLKSSAASLARAFACFAQTTHLKMCEIPQLESEKKKNTQMIRQEFAPFVRIVTTMRK